MEILEITDGSVIVSTRMTLKGSAMRVFAAALKGGSALPASVYGATKVIDASILTNKAIADAVKSCQGQGEL